MKAIVKPLFFIIALFGLSACSGAAAEAEKQTAVAAALAQVAQTMTAQSAALTAAVTPTPLPTETPTATPTMAPTATLVPTQVMPTVAVIPATAVPVTACDSAAYISDVTVPDGTEYEPGDEFTKTWQIQNTGSCTWSTSYSLVFVDGDKMGGSATALTEEVSPGETVKVSVDLIAPDDEDDYSGNWQMRNATGTNFGNIIYVKITVSSDEDDSSDDEDDSSDDDEEDTSDDDDEEFMNTSAFMSMVDFPILDVITSF